MTVLAMMGLISMPVTSLLPLATARSTSTPPPGPMMAYLPLGRNTFTTAGAADIRSFFQLYPATGGLPLSLSVGVAVSTAHLAGSTFMMAVEASASMTM